MKKCFCLGLLILLVFLTYPSKTIGDSVSKRCGPGTFTLAELVEGNSWSNYINRDIEYFYKKADSPSGTWTDGRFSVRWNQHIREVQSLRDEVNGECIDYIDTASSTLYSGQQLNGDLLVMTHTSFEWTGFSASWVGANRESASFLGASKPILQVVHGNSLGAFHSYFPEYDDWTVRNPNYYYVSTNGSIANINFQGTQLTVIGGTFGICHLQSLESIVANHNGSSITINMPMDAIACRDWLTLEDHYVANTQQEFLNYFNDQMITQAAININILNGQNTNYAIITQINGTEVQRYGGDTSQGAKPVYLNLTSSKSNSPSLNIISPEASTSYNTGDSLDIYWQGTGSIYQVDIYLKKNGTRHLQIANDIPNSGRYAWTISQGLDEGCNYAIEVCSAGTGSLWATDTSANICFYSPALISNFNLSPRTFNRTRNMSVSYTWSLNANQPINNFEWSFQHESNSYIDPATGQNTTTQWHSWSLPNCSGTAPNLYYYRSGVLNPCISYENWKAGQYVVTVRGTDGNGMPTNEDSLVMTITEDSFQLSNFSINNNTFDRTYNGLVYFTWGLTANRKYVSFKRKITNSSGYKINPDTGSYTSTEWYNWNVLQTNATNSCPPVNFSYSGSLNPFYAYGNWNPDTYTVTVKGVLGDGSESNQVSLYIQIVGENPEIYSFSLSPNSFSKSDNSTVPFTWSLTANTSQAAYFERRIQRVVGSFFTTVMDWHNWNLLTLTNSSDPYSYQYSSSLNPSVSYGSWTSGNYRVQVRLVHTNGLVSNSASAYFSITD